MKKIIVIILICFIYIYFSIDNNVVIPSEAIRFRLIADNNSNISQKNKFELNLLINNYLNKIIDKDFTYNDVNNVINSNIDNIKIITLQYLLENGLSNEFEVNFGKNYFPSKVYKGINYDEGYYNSLVITLGNGLGNNWWCVLFPPLCNLENENISDVQYKLYVNELINKVHNSSK